MDESKEDLGASSETVSVHQSIITENSRLKSEKDVEKSRTDSLHTTQAHLTQISHLEDHSRIIAKDILKTNMLTSEDLH